MSGEKVIQPGGKSIAELPRPRIGLRVLRHRQPIDLERAAQEITHQCAFVVYFRSAAQQENVGFWCNFSREGRLSLFQLLPTRQALLPIHAGSWPLGW